MQLLKKKNYIRSSQDFSSNKHYVRSPESAYFYKFDRCNRIQMACYCQNQLCLQLAQTSLCYKVRYKYSVTNLATSCLWNAL